MIQLPKDFDSIFRYIVVVSQRAEQLQTGAPARVVVETNKVTVTAQAEVAAAQNQLISN